MRHLMLFATLLLLHAQLSVSQTIIVDRSGLGQYTTIQAGIDAASDGDTVLVADGTYSGTGNQSITFKGKAIVVKSEQGPGNCFVDCKKLANTMAFVFNNPGDTSCVLEGFTIRNAKIGVWAYANSSPIIRNNVISSCETGIWSSSMATPTISGNTIQYNSHCAVLLEWSSAEVRQNMIRENQGTAGGGITCTNSSPVITGNTLTRNDGGEKGGGIVVTGNAHPVIQNNVIADNSAQYGGAIYAGSSSTPSIVNNTIVNNFASWGGGIFSEKSLSVVSNNIIALSQHWSAPEQKFWYDFVSHANYAGAKMTSVDYAFILHNHGQPGDVTIRSLTSYTRIDTTFFMQSEQRLVIKINSTLTDAGQFGGLSLDVTLGGETNRLSAPPRLWVNGYCSLVLTMAMEPCPLPASFEVVEIGTGSTFSYCDIYGANEGSYCTAASKDSLDLGALANWSGVEQKTLAGVNGNISADPLCESPDYRLKANSPCIDAGNPDPAFNDQTPTGMGSARNDIGAYGGPQGQPISCHVKPIFATQNVNDIHVTLTSNGRIGFCDYPANSLGAGFVFNGENHLFEGGLIIGKSPTQIVDVVRAHGGVQNTDFRPLDSFTLKTPGAVSDQDGLTSFSDSAAPASNRIGLLVEMHSYAFSDPPVSKFIILEYDIVNENPIAVSNLHAGIFLDWDLGSCTENMSLYDATRSLGYAFDNDASGPSAYVGIRALDGASSFRSLVNDTSIDISRPAKWDWISGGFAAATAGPADIHQVISSGPYTIPAGSTKKVAFALVAGDGSLAELQQNADEAKTRWDLLTTLSDIAGQFAGAPSSYQLMQNYPNPFNPSTAISFQLSALGPVKLEIFDLLGREVAVLVDEIRPAGSYTVPWNGSGHSSGVYFYRLRAGAFSETKRLILLR